MVEQLQVECAGHFHQRPCQWQLEIAFQLVQGKTLVSISATGSGKSYMFCLPMYYKNGLTIIIVPLKNLRQQLADESSQQGFCAVVGGRMISYLTHLDMEYWGSEC